MTDSDPNVLQEYLLALSAKITTEALQPEPDYERIVSLEIAIRQVSHAYSMLRSQSGIRTWNMPPVYGDGKFKSGSEGP